MKSEGPQPVRRFFMQGFTLLAIIFVMFFGLLQVADRLAARMPFAWEHDLLRWEKALMQSLFDTSLETPKDPIAQAWEAKLQEMANEIAATMDLPSEMKINIEYLPTPQVNAGATFAGHIAVFNGLVVRAPNENALAFIVAHEIAHVKLRHVARGMASQILVSRVVNLLFGQTGRLGEVAETGGVLFSQSYSRDMETAADELALAAMFVRYGHVRGMEEMFYTFKQSVPADKIPPEILSSHPDVDNRISHLKAIAAENGWPTTGPAVKLTAPIEVIELQKQRQRDQVQDLINRLNERDEAAEKSEEMSEATDE